LMTLMVKMGSATTRTRVPSRRLGKPRLIPNSRGVDGLMENATANNWRVEIVEKGPIGTICYYEDSKVASFEWEFGGGNVIAIIHGGSAPEWSEKYPWAADRRLEILERVGNEAIRQRAKTSTASLDERSGIILLRSQK
jgi:hypothetical protein